MQQCLIALGANRGDTEAAVRDALAALDAASHTSLARASSLFRTAPIGGPPGQAEFINAAALLETSQSAEQMLRWLLDLELEMGRVRTQRWGPREIDLDLLLFEQQTVAAEGLTVPHPRMSFRRFVLEPAAEAAPEFVHPKIGWTMQQLLDHLNSSPWFLAIAGEDATSWANRLAKRFGGAALLAGASQDVEPLLHAAREAATLVVADHVPDALPAELAPRLTACLGEGEIKPSGPALVLGRDAETIATDLEAAIEAMK